jgi:hypothetical protein
MKIWARKKCISVLVNKMVIDDLWANLAKFSIVN